MAPTYGFASQIGFDTVSTVTHRLDFQSEALVLNEEFLDTGGLRGTRAHVGERVRQNIRHVAGPLAFQPTSAELILLMPWIMGGTPSGTSYPLGDAVQTRYVVVDRGLKVFSYSGVAVDKASFRSSRGQPLHVTLDCIGQDESVGNSGTFPALTLDVSTNPFIFLDLVLTVNSVGYSCEEVDIEIENHIDRDRFFNSPTLTAVTAIDRYIRLRTRLPYGDASAAYALGVAGVTATALFSKGTSVLTFSFNNLKFPRRSPSVGGRQEIMLPLEGISYRTGSTLELATTLT